MLRLLFCKLLLLLLKLLSLHEFLHLTNGIFDFSLIVLLWSYKRLLYLLMPEIAFNTHVKIAWSAGESLDMLALVEACETRGAVSSNMATIAIPTTVVVFRVRYKLMWMKLLKFIHIDEWIWTQG